MILYDQDFNFIGMSAETLTFLGYEDIDEFTSMHNDFADLFVKKEGYIHRFENFSWIHYILYSGAANKKAFVSRKNGSEVCVDITIKEVFLNHAYDGLRMVYSVKLINENFTNISKTDVHDKRSKKSSEFSLQSLTQDLDMPQKAPKEAVETTAAPLETPAVAKAPEPLDFKLDIPDSSIFQQKEEEEAVNESADSQQPSTVPEVKTESFILNIPDLEEATSHEETAKSTETEMGNHFNFDTMQQQTPQTETKEEPAPMLSETAQDFAFDLLKNDSEGEEQTFETVPANESLQQNSEKETKEEESNNEIFHFDLLKEEKASPVPAEAPEAEEKSTPFAFNLFDTEKTEEEELSPQENLTINDKEESAETANDQQTPFSFNLFTTEETQEEPEPAENSEKASLISQIKSDIEEIDNTEVQVNLQEQENASEKLHELMQKSSFKEQKPEKTPEKEDIFELASLLKTDTPEEEQKKESSSPSGNLQLQNQNNTISGEHTFSTKAKDEVMEESSFEETLKDIFSFEEKQNQRTEKDIKLKLFDTETYVEKNKQHVTKEDIKSPFQSDAEAQEQLDMPKLGNLGLSKEEELDFIEEFLEDTLATITLMQEYVALEDYDNIKYNLIKISSSAEILHFDQMLEHTRSLSDSCDNKEKNAIVQKLEKLQKIAKQYKEHFTAIAV